MNFDELLEALRGDDPPETIYDDLSSAYHTAVEGSAAKIAESEGVIEALNDEISKLKAQNFDLLMAAPAEPSESSESEDEDEAPVDRPANYDDMFDYERD